MQSPNGQKGGRGFGSFREGAAVSRYHVIILVVILSVMGSQGCATQDQATRAAEQAVSDAEDDASCQKKGAPDSPAYDACRKELAEARARAGAIQEQKRRDFDRVLGAGTDGQSNY
jgi:hypothetical protein